VEEKKLTRIPLVTASEKGKAQTWIKINFQKNVFSSFLFLLTVFLFLRIKNLKKLKIFLKCSLWKYHHFLTLFFFKDFFVFSSINPLEKGIIEGDNPVYDLKKKVSIFSLKCWFFLESGCLRLQPKAGC